MLRVKTHHQVMSPYTASKVQVKRCFIKTETKVTPLK